MAKVKAAKALMGMFKGKKPKAKKSSTSTDIRSYQERRPGMVKNKRGQTPMEAQGLIDAKGNPLSKPSKSLPFSIVLLSVSVVFSQLRAENSKS